MKVLFQHLSPFFLAHGGLQTQIEQTRAGLESAGVEVEYVRWWDDGQAGDLIHFFGRPGTGFVHMAHQKKLPVVMSDLLTGQGSRPLWKLRLQREALWGIDALCPSGFCTGLSRRVYRAVDACCALTPWEARLMTLLYGADPAKVHVIPNGVEKEFLDEPSRPRGKWLICTATIADRKRVLELAEAAAMAQTPLWIIGKPYAESDPYYMRFREFAESHSEWIRYEGAIAQRHVLARIYREARGFVLLSTKESLSLSALEAAACECPLLLSDLPWARVSFGAAAAYGPIASPRVTAAYLRRFYDEAPALEPPSKPLTWREVGGQLRKIYEAALRTSR